MLACFCIGNLFHVLEYRRNIATNIDLIPFGPIETCWNQRNILSHEIKEHNLFSAIQKEVFGCFKPTKIALTIKDHKKVFQQEN